MSADWLAASAPSPSATGHAFVPAYWVPDSQVLAVFLGIFAMAAWGSWANLLKLNNGATRFEFFFLDYQAGSFLIAIFLVLFLGLPGFSTGLTWSTIFAAFAAGALNTLGTLLVMASVELSGMTIVFPIVVGIEMAIGTTLLWLIERRESPALLFTGVVCALCAVYLDYRSHSEGRNSEKGDAANPSGSIRGSGNLQYASLSVGAVDDEDLIEDDPFSSDLSDLTEPYKMGRRSKLSQQMAAASGMCSKFSSSLTRAQRGTAMCVFAALFFSLWPVLDALSTEGCAADVKGSPYAFFIFFRMAALVFTWFVVACMAKFSISVESSRTLMVGDIMQDDDPDAITLQKYLKEVPMRSRLLGLLAGATWGLGTMFSLVAGEVVGLGVSITLTRCSPLVATFWGVCLWKEAEDMSAKAKRLLLGMVFFYILSIIFVSASAPADASVDGEAGDC